MVRISLDQDLVYFWSVLMTCVLLAASGRSTFAAEASGTGPGLSLRVEIDRREFLPGEPILIGLSIENSGSEPFEDLSKLNPAQEFIHLRLTRDGNELPWTGRQETWLFTEEGTRLEPGAKLCDVFDLLEYFGSRSTTSLGERSFTFRRSLAPGSYSLRPRFRARIGIRKDLPQVVVEGNEISFIVRDASAIPASEVAALELLQLSPHRDVNMAYARPIRWYDIRDRGLSRSRYLGSLARMFPLPDSVDVVALAEECASAGGGKLSAAGLLRGRYERFGNRLNASEAWLNRAGRDDTKGLFTCFLRMWEAGVAQGRKYGRGEN